MMRAILRGFPGSLLGFILASYIVILLLPMAVSGIYGSYLISENTMLNQRRTMIAATRSAAAQTARYVKNSSRAVDSIADRLKVREGTDSSDFGPSDREAMRIFREAVLGIDSIFVLDRSLKVLAVVPDERAQEGADFSRRTFASEIREGETVLARPFVDPQDGSVFAAVLRADGPFVVAAFLRLGTLSDFLLPLRYAEWDDLAVVDATGAFIAHTEQRFVRERDSERHFSALVGAKDNEMVFQKIDGTVHFSAAREIAGTSWRVVYYRDAQLAESVMGRFQFQYLTMVYSLALIALLFIVSARISIKHRFSALLNRIRRIESGDLSNSVPGSENWKEFREIGEAFSAMADRIAEREEELRMSEGKYRGLFQRNKAVNLIIDGNDGRIMDANPSALEFYKRTRDELLSMRIQDINSSDGDTADEEIRAAAEERRTHSHFRHRVSDGGIRDVEVYASPVEWEGERRLYMLVFDVTDRKIAEGRVASALAEKEVLLREIHHRVKNNLQIMASLISLQAYYVKDESDAVLFEASQDRILSMAALHELLYEHEDLSEIDLSEYLSMLADNLAGSIQRSGAVIEKRLEKIIVNPDIALPFGLIANELLTNAVKYAFPPQRRERSTCSIRLCLDRIRDAHGEETIVLTVQDDGIGPPANFDPENSKTLGLSLVRNLSLQIAGAVTYDGKEGFTAKVTIPSPDSSGLS